MRSNEYGPDFQNTLTIAATASDAKIQIPSNMPGDIIQNPTQTGSLYYICVDGNPVAIYVGATGTPAVFPSTTGANNAVLEVGSPLTLPVYLPPGEYFHAICASGKTAIVSLIRAKRA